MASVDLEDVCSLLSPLSEDEIVESAVALLAEPRDWAQSVLVQLKRLQPAQFVDMFFRAARPNVEPTAFLIAESSCGRVQVVINLFDLSAFDSALEEGRLSPHHHSRAFASRVLTGGFHQWLYNNLDGGDPKNLQITGHLACGAGCVYKISAEKYHFVFGPKDRTVSLLIRGPERYTGGWKSHLNISEAEVLARRDDLCAALSLATQSYPGRIAIIP